MTLWTVARQAPPSVGFSRQECWSGLSCPPSGDRLDPGIKPASLRSPALADRLFTSSATQASNLCHDKPTEERTFEQLLARKLVVSVSTIYASLLKRAINTYIQQLQGGKPIKKSHHLLFSPMCVYHLCKHIDIYASF